MLTISLLDRLSRQARGSPSRRLTVSGSSRAAAADRTRRCSRRRWSLLAVSDRCSWGRWPRLADVADRCPRPRLDLLRGCGPRPVLLASERCSRHHSAVGRCSTCRGGPPEERGLALGGGLKSRCHPGSTRRTSQRVTVYEVLYWCITDVLDLLKETPPPPLGLHDLKKIVAEYTRLQECAWTESVEEYAGTCSFLRLQWATWQMYGDTVKGYPGGVDQVIFESLRRSCPKSEDGEIRPRLLSSFGLKPENLPLPGVSEYDFIGGMLYSADRTRDVVGQYRRRVKGVEGRREKKAKEEKERHAIEDGFMPTKEEKEDGLLGGGGV
ncbi:hypothetical protein ACP70R_025800 [Stipagrostis hirtigluma subsp. patula]